MELIDVDRPARPYLGTSFSSFTTMFRSSSFAFFDMLRACCDPQPPKLCCATRRKHDVHWGSSDDMLTDAIEKVRQQQRGAAFGVQPQIWR